MLSAEDLREWYERLGLSETSRSAIDHIDRCRLRAGSGVGAKMLVGGIQAGRWA
jgi:hypothetical protein